MPVAAVLGILLPESAKTVTIIRKDIERVPARIFHFDEALRQAQGERTDR